MLSVQRQIQLHFQSFVNPFTYFLFNLMNMNTGVWIFRHMLYKIKFKVTDDRSVYLTN